MRIDPSGAELLALARTAVLEELLPQLPASAHYTARMVCNAMAIAQRQLQAAHAPGATTTLTTDDWQGIWQLTCEQLAESDPKALPG
mgnify:FL=1